MSKPFKTLDEQIEILKTRGLTIGDEEKAKNTLLFTNYYNVINCYSKFFQQSSDVYISGTTFIDVMSVYHFDKEMKNMFFKNIIEVEKSFKSTLAYIFSENHPEEYSYLDIKNYEADSILVSADMIAKLARVIKKKERDNRNNAVKHYINQHNNVPLWVLINYLDFGQVIDFYSCMKRSEKNKIAKVFSENLSRSLGTQVRIEYVALITILNNIREVRNVAAHNNKILGFSCKKNVPYLTQLHSPIGIQPNDPKQNVYNVYVVMRIFMSTESYNNFTNKIKKQFNYLRHNMRIIDYNNVTSSLGFPQNWVNTL